MWKSIGNRLLGSNPNSNESTTDSQSDSIDTDNIIELQSHLLTLLSLTDSKAWQIDQTSVPALMEETRAHLIPIIKFFEKKLPLGKEGVGKVNEMAEMMVLNAKFLLLKLQLQHEHCLPRINTSGHHRLH